MSGPDSQMQDAIEKAERLLGSVPTETQADAELIAALQAALRAGRLHGTAAPGQESPLPGDFASVVSHELLGALMPISLFVDVTLRELATGQVPSHEVLTRRFGIFQRQIKRVSSDLKRLLDFSRIRSGRLDLELEEVDLSSVAADVVDAHRLQIEHSRCAVTLEAPEPVVGLWDRLRLQQVVGNLFSNAIKYGAGAPVLVTVSGSDERGSLLVRDHGIGLPAGKEDIFARFERGFSSRGQAGYGVGLWVVARVVEALRGQIQVASPPGAGAAFTVTLPRRRDV